MFARSALLVMSGLFLLMTLATTAAQDKKPYGDKGPKDAAVQVAVFIPPSPCHDACVKMLNKLAEEYPKFLRVTIEPMNSESAKKLKVACAVYLMKVEGVEPPKDKKMGDYEILFGKSPEVGKWKVEDLEKKVLAGLKKVDAKKKGEDGG
jgi:hypothetical protein